jgi:group I intron endonuclease
MKPLFVNEQLLKKEPKEIGCFGYIYCLTNLANNKLYIGQTTISIYRRWLTHKNNKTEYISHAIKKHGVDKFKVELLDICYSKDEINTILRYYKWQPPI